MYDDLLWGIILKRSKKVPWLCTENVISKSILWILVFKSIGYSKNLIEQFIKNLWNKLFHQIRWVWQSRNSKQCVFSCTRKSSFDLTGCLRRTIEKNIAIFNLKWFFNLLEGLATWLDSKISLKLHSGIVYRLGNVSSPAEMWLSHILWSFWRFNFWL